MQEGIPRKPPVLMISQKDIVMYFLSDFSSGKAAKPRHDLPYVRKCSHEANKPKQECIRTQDQAHAQARVSRLNEPVGALSHDERPST
jgi:hypothetical protein